MNKCLIVGRPNVGKTAFLLSFAKYCGLKELEIRVKTSDGTTISKRRSIDAAYSELVQPTSHTTQELQSVLLDLPFGKGQKTLELVDSSGLIDGIHPSPAIRRAMARTLEAIALAQIIIHILDAALIGLKGTGEGIGAIDWDLAEYAKQNREYLLLANKMDLSGANQGLALIRKSFTGVRVYPVSAKTMQGFKEVRRHVLRAC
ncbi:MAG: 50S ribosome-binding GTPase [Firmicutes bacterium]|nr:50S ribosome-binding GTPase [Bacillota bacterium]